MPTPEQMIAEYPLMAQRVAALEAQVAWFKKQVFGGGKSERLDPAQRQLALSGVEETRAAVAEHTERVTYERTKRREPRPTPAEAFAHIPVTETVELVPEAVRQDPALYERIGEERTFELDVIPPKLVKRELVRPKYRHRLDRTRAPLLAAAPARVVPGGYASAGLIAWVVLSKYVDHLPLYRQEQMSARWGATISRRTLCDWIEVAALWLEPIYRQMHRQLLAGSYLQADETPIRCNDPDHDRGKTLQCYLWVISRPQSDVVFAFRESRAHSELSSLLGGFRGLLQSDQYGAYASHERQTPGIVRVGCWAHARRKFHEALDERPKAARLVLKVIGRLYHVEPSNAPGMKRTSATSAPPCGKPTLPDRCTGCAAWPPASLARHCLNPSSARPASTCSTIGTSWWRTSTTRSPASTTIWSKTRSAPRPSAKRTGSSSATPPLASAPPSSTRSSSPASATARTRTRICAMSCGDSPR